MKMIGKTCFKCSNKIYPSHSRCPICKGTVFEELELKNGRVITYTTVYATSIGVKSPLSLAIIEFDSCVRALCQITGKLETNLSVKPEFVILRKKKGKTLKGLRYKKDYQNR